MPIKKTPIIDPITGKRKFNETFVGSKQGFDFFVKESTYAPAQKITMEDVWGKYDDRAGRRISKGMVVASSMTGYPNKCPVWKDILPKKSVTVICNKRDEGEVIYWLEYVHGGGSISRRKELPKGKVALRSDYQAW